MTPGSSPGPHAPAAPDARPDVPAGSAATGDTEAGVTPCGVDTLSHGALPERDGEPAAKVHSRQGDCATARESLQRAQDLSAELFRLREQMKMTSLVVEEARARVLDLEAQVGVRGAQREELMRDLAERSSQLSQAMSLHEHDSMRWQAELERARQALQHELFETSKRMQHERDIAVAEARKERDLAVADMQQMRQNLDQLQANADVLVDVLSSRSWRLTWPLRSIMERVRGRRWVEPELHIPITAAKAPRSEPGDE